MTKIKQLLGVHGDESLIKYLQRIQRPWYWQLFGVVGFLTLFYFVVGNIYIAATLLISIYLHELGHGIVYTVYKIRWRLQILFPLGAIVEPATQEEKEKSDQIHWRGMAIFSYAGILANLFLLAVGVILKTSSVLQINLLGETLTSINSFFIFLNVLPIWKLDGKLFWKTVFSSLDGKWDKTVGAFVITTALFIAVIILMVPGCQHWQTIVVRAILNSGWLGLVMVIAAGVWHTQGHDNEDYYKSERAMNTRQVIIQIAIYFAILTSTVLLTY